ncbi:ATP-binding protein [Polaromonas sp. SM01]|uniref:ATP-binding protein n=1 Tax=Polaromonas sp. SM01 TaxID=3085630 RepID=UPI00298274E3|nr:ATP-binding protein [Polaromonas sp. SM01]MDW5443817.1 ATP-binding protein [Polaromonas sp. SM01]
MKYQLRRMVLVNAGTNMHVPSGRITAIDPRGGAAVLGDNGVGKTTTLRILPLFFGHLPSQIVSTGQGQEPMVRFVLPTDASAVAFEYQRGSDSEDDIRLVVIRRRNDDPDVPVYRLYRCGFRKELFVDDGRFLDDDETQLKATAFGIQTTSKLSTSEYRAVILRTPATSKEKERLRRYSLEWSFGPKQLDNLDRLVAAMVKKHINFADIVQVAIGLVQQDLGHGSERAKLTFKQGKGPIERWLKNRDACADAFKLAPRIAELEDDLKDHRAAEARFRARRADVAAVRTARVAERTELSKAIEVMVAARVQTVEALALERATLAHAASRAGTAASTAKSDYDEQATQASYFEDQRAAHWETQVQDLPSLRLNRQTIDKQVAAAESAHAEATAKYAAMAHEVRTKTTERSLALEQEKQPHRDRLEYTLAQIFVAEDASKKEAGVLQAERRQQLEETLEPLVEQRGMWELRKGSPAASEAALKDAEQANDWLSAHLEAKGKADQEHSRAEAAVLAARQAFSDQEQAIRDAKAECASATASLEGVRLLLTPNPGTLLAALRGHGDDAWKRTLAKVINPALLERDDLNPAAVEDAAQTIYGWQLSTGVIASPDWVDDALAKKAVEAAVAREGGAQAHLLSVQDSLTGKGQALKEAEQAMGIAQAGLGVLGGQTETLKTTLATAKLRVQTEKRDAVTQAASELARLKVDIDAIKLQQRNLQVQLADELGGIKKANDIQRAEAKRLQDEAIAAINASIARLGTELKATLEGFAAQLAEHLTSAGVDVKRLDALKSEAARVTQEVVDREERAPMVNRWRDWVAAGGSSRVGALKKTAQQTQEASRLCAAELTEFDARAQKATTEYEAALSAKNKRLAEVDDELEVLMGLDDEFGDYQATGQSVIDTKTAAKELRGLVRADQAMLDKVEANIKQQFSTLRQALTAKDNAVRELVEASLLRLSEGSGIARAAELCTCYKLIGPQIANDVNITLKTLLANIGAFQKAIQSFEKEVAAFNRRLQDGLTEVRCFERIKDLRLDIITNFENLGFYKKLARMDDIVRQHANEFGKDFTRELPPDETARALGDFVSVLSIDGSVEVNLSSHITLNGSVTDNGQRKEFKRASELENISSEGLTSLILITLMTALLNTIRGAEPVHVPWVTDEVGKFDPKNFLALMRMLQDNRIDVVTASPELGPAQQAMFSQRYLFEDRGRVREYSPLGAQVSSMAPQSATQEVLP